MKPIGTMSSYAGYLLVIFACGAPVGGVLIVLSWWLLTLVVDPAKADEWWEYALIAVYILGPVWAPFLSGLAVLRVAARFSVDWRSA